MSDYIYFFSPRLCLFDTITFHHTSSLRGKYWSISKKYFWKKNNSTWSYNNNTKTNLWNSSDKIFLKCIYWKAFRLRCTMPIFQPVLLTVVSWRPTQPGFSPGLTIFPRVLVSSVQKIPSVMLLVPVDPPKVMKFFFQLKVYVVVKDEMYRFVNWNV